jgi:hypothetical protein
MAALHKNGTKAGHCYHCGKKLARSVNLDLNSSSGKWSSVGWDERDSQGWFEFGPDCAEKLDDDADNGAVSASEVAARQITAVSASSDLIRTCTKYTSTPRAMSAASVSSAALLTVATNGAASFPSG